MAHRKLHICENCNKQSLMTVLNKFVEAVNTMDAKVMVPSRLRDMEFTQQASAGNPTEVNNNMSVLPFSSGRGEDLYSYYEMINAIKGEILTGTASRNGNANFFGANLSESDGDSDSISEDSSDDGSDMARKTAQAFRHHLQGLFGLLHQLTDTAKFLGDAYEEQIGGRKTKKFSI